MNKDVFAGQWKMIQGKVKEHWGRLTDDEVTQISGKREQLLGLLQKKYGFAREKAQQELDRFLTGLNLTGAGIPRSRPENEFEDEFESQNVSEEITEEPPRRRKVG